MSQILNDPARAENVVSELKNDALAFFARNEILPLLESMRDSAPLQILNGMTEREVQQLAHQYAKAIQCTAKYFCEKLVPEVGATQCIGNEEECWIRERVREFIHDRISLGAVRDYLSHFSYDIENQNEGQTLFETLAHLAQNTDFFVMEADRSLKRAAALYSKGCRSDQSSKTQLSRLTDFETTHGSGVAEGSSELSGEFTHTPDYSTVTYKGRKHQLTPRRARALQILHREYQNGNPVISQASVLAELGTAKSRLRDTFRNSDLWNSLLIPSKKPRGFVRLNLPHSG